MSDQIELKEEGSLLTLTREEVSRWMRASCQALRIAGIVAIIAAILGLCAIFAHRLLGPSVTLYRSNVEFRFDGIDKGMFPSGMPFAVGDLEAPAVLDEVHRSLNLASYGVDRDEFASAVSVTASSVIKDAVVAGFNRRLAERGLSLTERQAIENELAQRLQVLGQRRAEIRFSVASIRDVPEEIGLAVVAAIPSVWARQVAEDERAFIVSELASQASAQALLDATDVSEGDFLAAHVALVSTLRDSLRDLRQRPAFTTTQRDEQTGLSLRDIETRLEFYEAVELTQYLRQTLPQAPLATRNRFSHALGDLIQRRQLAAASIIDQANAIEALIESLLAQNGTDTGSAPNADIVVQQPSGDAGVLLGMQIENQRYSYVRELADRLIPLRARVAAVRADLGFVEGYARLAETPAETAAPRSASLTPPTANLMTLFGATERLGEKINNLAISNPSALYAVTATLNPAQVLSAWFTIGNVMLALAGVIFASAGAFFVALLVFLRMK